jgi:OFA family oxalate/formate antiporter-like MFS transporter
MANTEKKVLNRWLVVVGAILIQLCLGAIYAWSAFDSKLTTEGGDYGFSKTQFNAIFSAGLAAFALIMAFVGGPWQKKSGPRIVAVTGGIVLGIGYILGGFLGKTFIAQFILIGLVGGSGIGLAYVVPIAVGAKWFPDKKGMIMGLAVAGFGFGATIWVKLAGSWFGGLLNKVSISGLPGVQSVFILYGIVFAVLVLIGSIWMVNPPEGWLPRGYTPPAPKPGAKVSARGTTEFSIFEMFSTPQFYMLWLTFIFSAGTGLMVIGCIQSFGTDALRLKAVMFEGLDAGAIKAAAIKLLKNPVFSQFTDTIEQIKKGTFTDYASLPSQLKSGIVKEVAGGIAGTAMALYAIFNGLGRIIWGMVSDKIGRKPAIFSMCCFQGIIMLAFFTIGQNELGLIIGACVIGFNFGGNFALFPAATADFFGNKSVGTNYGWMFTAYGIGGIVMPLIAGRFRDMAKAAAANLDVIDISFLTKAWIPPLVIGGIVCLLAAFISIMAKPPQKKST